MRFYLFAMQHAVYHITHTKHETDLGSCPQVGLSVLQLQGHGGGTVAGRLQVHLCLIVGADMNHFHDL